MFLFYKHLTTGSLDVSVDNSGIIKISDWFSQLLYWPVFCILCLSLNLFLSRADMIFIPLPETKACRSNGGKFVRLDELLNKDHERKQRFSLQSRRQMQENCRVQWFKMTLLTHTWCRRAVEIAYCNYFQENNRKARRYILSNKVDRRMYWKCVQSIDVLSTKSRPLSKRVLRTLTNLWYSYRNSDIVNTPLCKAETQQKRRRLMRTEKLELYWNCRRLRLHWESYGSGSSVSRCWSCNAPARLTEIWITWECSWNWSSKMASTTPLPLSPAYIPAAALLK